MDELTATLAASDFGAPELAPVIGAAAKFAESRFQEKKVKTKRRDPFGEDPGTGAKARQEGGVIVSLPQPGVTTQIYYSGNSDHEERWIKKPGTRDTAHLPDHVKKGGRSFFRAVAATSVRLAPAVTSSSRRGTTSLRTTLASTALMFS